MFNNLNNGYWMDLVQHHFVVFFFFGSCCCCAIIVFANYMDIVCWKNHFVGIILMIWVKTKI